MNEKGKKNFLLAAVFLLAVAIGYWFGIKSDSDGSRAADITAKLDEALANQRRLTAQLDGISKGIGESVRRVESIEGRIGRVEAGINEAQRRFGESDRLISESRRLNSENERLVRTILERNEGQGKAGRN